MRYTALIEEMRDAHTIFVRTLEGKRKPMRSKEIRDYIKIDYTNWCGVDSSGSIQGSLKG
jgi:hypothetical protein